MPKITPAKLLAKTVKCEVRAVKEIAQRGQPARPRGNWQHPAFINQQFAKGENTRRRKGDAKPKQPYVKLKDRLVAELANPASATMKARVGLRGQQTQYDCILASLAQHAIADANVAFKMRDVVEGLLPTRNFSVSADMQVYLQDPEFLQWLQQQHGQFMELEDNNGQQNFEAGIRFLPAAETTEGGSDD
jgi:hypothetical protein